MNDIENSYENIQNSNNFDASEPTQPLDFNSIENVCHGVKYYWQTMLLSILVNICLPVICYLIILCFPKLAAVVVFAFLAVFSPNLLQITGVGLQEQLPPNFSALLQAPPEVLLQWCKLIVVAVYLAVSAYYALCLCVPIYKSMTRLYKTPDSVCPNARRLLNASWLLFAIAFCVTGFTIYFFNTPFRRILFAVAVAISFSSSIVFYRLLDKIGAIILPKNKYCHIAIVLLVITLVFSVAEILFYSYLPTKVYRFFLPFRFIEAIAVALIFVYIFLLQRRCSEILQTGTFTLPAPQSPEVPPSSVLRTGFDKLKSIRNLRLIILISTCVLLLGATVYYRNAYPSEGQKINWSWSSFFSPQRDKSPYQEIQNWNDAVYKLNHGDISKEFFVRWVYMTYLPDLESKYRSDTSEKLKEEYFRNGILKEKIDCCMTFRKALKQESPEALQQAIENVYRTDLKEFKAEQENGWNHKVPLTTNDALLLAVSMDDLDMAQWLVSVGADVNYKNRDEETPLQIAKDKNNQRMIEFLLNNGAIDPDKK